MNYLLHSIIPNNVPDEEETKGEEPPTIDGPTLVRKIAIKSISERYKIKKKPGTQFYNIQWCFMTSAT